LLAHGLEADVELLVEGAHMGAALAGADYEEVGHLEALRHVDDADIRGLLGVEQVGDRDGEFLGDDRESSG
jgi:hypothetical protein